MEKLTQYEGGDELAELRELVDAQTLILAEIGEHLAILRTVILYMLLQATADETDQTEEGNPWKKLLKDFKALLNPHIKKLNQLLGVKVEDAPAPKPLIVAKL